MHVGSEKHQTLPETLNCFWCGL